MKSIQLEYHSYLIRVWRDFQEEHCRVLLQDVLSCESHYFSSLPALVAFLERNLETPYHAAMGTYEDDPIGENIDSGNMGQ